ncbi:hypothetical protein niasHT_013816 [Heterodera trifolii]|uniref:Sodium/nucleoside cotransporter n=1 Tax=Heterodera trifolii TaxID=157864 RepID=A0ABD2KTT6_9BILA
MTDKNDRQTKSQNEYRLDEQIKIDPTDGTAEYGADKNNPPKMHSSAAEVLENGGTAQSQTNERKKEIVSGKNRWNPMEIVEHGQEGLIKFFKENRTLITACMLITLLILYHVLIVLALFHNLDKAFTLFIITLFGWLYFIYQRILSPFLHRQKFVGQFKMQFRQFLEPLKANVILRRFFYGLAVGLPILFIVWDTRHNLERLSGLFGLIVFLIFMCFISHKPTKVNWRPVLWGFLLQFIFGIAVLRWEYGSRKFVDLSNTAIAFLDFAKNGTDFTYGFLSAPPNICGMEPVIAFQTIQVIIYVGAIVSVLYFYGIVQAVLKRMAMLMQLTLGTTATESLNACACVLLGNAESPLLIRPYIERMTASELHAVMTTGFACIAGAVFAAYISFGACPRYLLSAAVMSAPGSLACSKLLYPETEKSSVKNVKDLELPPSKESNAMECIANGSIMSVHLVTAVCANLISFMAIMALINAIVGYFGILIGYDDWSLELFLGYLFYPIAYMIGVTENAGQTFLVARLLGVKIVINDFVAYQRLGVMLKLDLLTPRSAMIATYALCSFSDFIAAGIQLAVLSEMAPTRKALIARLVLRALLAGCISCFMSAAIAGILIEVPVACRPSGGNGTKCFDLNVHQRFMEDILANSTAFKLRDEL